MPHVHTVNFSESMFALLFQHTTETILGSKNSIKWKNGAFTMNKLNWF